MTWNIEETTDEGMRIIERELSEPARQLAALFGLKGLCPGVHVHQGLLAQGARRRLKGRRGGVDW